MTRKRFFQPDELSAIRSRCDWRRLLDGLGVRADIRRCTEAEFWGYSPFHPDEKTASFHMKAPGVWYDWSSHAEPPGRGTPGGGVIELVQAVHAARGQIMKLNEAAGWLLDQGYSALDATTPPAPPPPPPRTTVEPAATEKRNAPITIDLVPRLSQHGTHPAFVERGISAETCRYLRCGYLEGGRTALANRLVFQVGGLTEDFGARVILSHIGRATTPEQEAKGKWRHYRGFTPSLALHNADNLILDEEAAAQAAATGTVVIVEGAFDVAKCVEAGLRNVVATFGAHLHERQAGLLRDLLSHLGASRALAFYDRDTAGEKATAEAVALLRETGIEAAGFDWRQRFHASGRPPVSIPETVTDPCDFSVRQLRWLRGQGVV